jgi:hypothetical protein
MTADPCAAIPPAIDMAGRRDAPSCLQRRIQTDQFAAKQ